MVGAQRPSAGSMLRLVTSGRSAPPWSGCLLYRDRVAHNGAEVLAHVVVARLPRLHAAHLIGGPGHQGVCALSAHVPAVRPADPHETVSRLFDVGRVPTFSTVHAHVDLIDGAGT